MAYLRALGVFFTLIGFFAIGAPMQWLVLRLKPSFAYVLPLLFNRLLLNLLRIRVVLHGETPQACSGAAPPQMLVANHISWIDVPALGTLNTISFLAKQEVARWPIIATFARLQSTIFVDRDSRKSIREANAAMAARMRDGGWVALFPEGTTHDGLALGRFHSSHFAAARDILDGNPHIEAVRIQPVAIRYSAAHAAWLGDDLLLPHVMELVRGPPMTCDLFLSAPLNFDRASDRKLIARQCTERIGAILAANEAADPHAASPVKIESSPSGM